MLMKMFQSIVLSSPPSENVACHESTMVVRPQHFRFRIMSVTKQMAAFARAFDRQRSTNKVLTSGDLFMKINAITLCNPVDLRPPLNKLEASASANWFAANFRVWAKLYVSGTGVSKMSMPKHVCRRWRHALNESKKMVARLKSRLRESVQLVSNQRPQNFGLLPYLMRPRTSRRRRM